MDLDNGYWYRYGSVWFKLVSRMGTGWEGIYGFHIHPFLGYSLGRITILLHTFPFISTVSSLDTYSPSLHSLIPLDEGAFH
jgi:hypothetical protein